jgi:hypothetical protein
MNRLLARHVIVGSEVGEPRPPAYMRRGRTRRTRSRRRRPNALLWWAAATAILMLVALLSPWR